MPKSASQKLKLLYLKDILLKKTDEGHPMTAQELITELSWYGISAERKSIYDDIETLRLYGTDIILKSRREGFFVASREFELPEVKLLIDSVQASKFITHRKSEQLIKKIESFASVHEARGLQRQVYVAGRIKNMNESIYYNVDKIHCAITENRELSFKYTEYTVSKEQKFRRGGEEYRVSPLALAWDNENYYMLGFDAQSEKIKHYRVDKMDCLKLLETPRQGLEEFSKTDMAAYSKKIFSMYGGNEETVRLKFTNELIGVVIDRFGKDIAVLKSGENGFETSVRVYVSPQFFGWLCSFGGAASILAPEAVAAEFKRHVRAVLEA